MIVTRDTGINYPNTRRRKRSTPAPPRLSIRETSSRGSTPTRSRWTELRNVELETGRFFLFQTCKVPGTSTQDPLGPGTTVRATGGSDRAGRVDNEGNGPSEWTLVTPPTSSRRRGRAASATLTTTDPDPGRRTPSLRPASSPATSAGSSATSSSRTPSTASTGTGGRRGGRPRHRASTSRRRSTCTRTGRGPTSKAGLAPRPRSPSGRPTFCPHGCPGTRKRSPDGARGLRRPQRQTETCCRACPSPTT